MTILTETGKTPLTSKKPRSSRFRRSRCPWTNESTAAVQVAKRPSPTMSSASGGSSTQLKDLAEVHYEGS